MSLPSKASDILSRATDSIRDLAMLDRIRVEIARCQIQMSKSAHDEDDVKAALNSSREILRNALKTMAARGDDRQGMLIAQVELADIALILNEDGLAVAGARPILDDIECPDALRRRARQILAVAYVRQGMYTQAADALVDEKAKAVGGKNNG